MVGVRLELECFALRQLLAREHEADISSFRDNLRHIELAFRDDDRPAGRVALGS